MSLNVNDGEIPAPSQKDQTNLEPPVETESTTAIEVATDDEPPLLLDDESSLLLDDEPRRKGRLRASLRVERGSSTYHREKVPPSHVRTGIEHSFKRVRPNGPVGRGDRAWKKGGDHCAGLLG